MSAASAEQALAIVPVCEALQYAHEHGIVHRGIAESPHKAPVKIADSALRRCSARTDRMLALRNPNHRRRMAPEQKQNRTR
jgi:hypothetical protein